MFTGIVETTGLIRELRRDAAEASMVVSARDIAPELKVGDSIAVNGACLTVVHCTGDAFRCDLSAETLTRTIFGKAREGARVNLERPLLVGSRLGGHFVQGHIDGIGNLVSMVPSGEGTLMTMEYPAPLGRYLVVKGSIAVDGISLTIASLQGNRFAAALIPHTLKQTNLGTMQPGDPANIEVDILAKYFERFFQLGAGQERPDRWSPGYLREQGF